MRQHDLDTWVYSGNDWLITKIDAPHVAREAWTVKFEPKVVANVLWEVKRMWLGDYPMSANPKRPSLLRRLATFVKDSAFTFLDTL